MIIFVDFLNKNFRPRLLYGKRRLFCRNALVSVTVPGKGKCNLCRQQVIYVTEKYPFLSDVNIFYAY